MWKIPLTVCMALLALTLVACASTPSTWDTGAPRGKEDNVQAFEDILGRSLIAMETETGIPIEVSNCTVDGEYYTFVAVYRNDGTWVECYYKEGSPEQIAALDSLEEGYSALLQMYDLEPFQVGRVDLSPEWMQGYESITQEELDKYTNVPDYTTEVGE